MTVEKSVLAFAGFMTLLSLVLTVTVHPGFIWLTVFVGLNQIQSAFTGFCLAAFAFKAMGLKSCSAK